MIQLIDVDAIERRGRRIALLAKSTWIPVAAGIVLLAIANAWTGLLASVGWIALVAGVGLGAWRLTKGRAAMERKAIQELRAELNEEHREYLRELRRQSRVDGDARTVNLIRRLGETFDRMLDDGMFELYRNVPWQAEVRTRMVDLYRSAVAWLQRAYELWQAQQTLASAEGRAKLNAERESLMQEVDTTIQQLGQTLDQLKLQDLDRKVPDQKLIDLRDELTRGVEVARRVDQRMETLQREVLGREGRAVQ
jgi:hypothetical protein